MLRSVCTSPHLRLAMLALAILPAGGCINASVAESDIYRPIAAGALTAKAVAASAPAYTLEPQTITARDGTMLRGVWLRQAGARRTVLFFGGNGFTTEQGAKIAPLFARLGVDLMMMDHRGYGTSDAGPGGAAAVQTLMTDGEDAFDYLASRPGMSPGAIVLHGHSLGSFVAGHVAAVRNAGAVVLQSSATTADDFVRGQVPWYARPAVKIKVSEGLKTQGNLANMTEIAEPLLIVVGAEDKITAPAMSLRLYEASPLTPGRKVLSIVKGRGHNDVFAAPAAVEAYRSFLASLAKISG